MKLATRLANRYELSQELSSPNHQRVGKRTFLAQDIQTQASVVVKIIQLTPAVPAAEQWAALKLFKRESEVLATLNYPTIPQFKASFETEFEGVRSFVMVQTYIEAESLETLIQSGKRFSEAEALALAEQLLTTLDYLHTQSPSIIHRDIKPSNILISSHQSVYLIDFGSIHTDLTKETGTITIVGSYGYIPLEQFTGQAVPASDLYALGMTLVYLVTGVHPADLVRLEGKIQLPQHSLSLPFVRCLERLSTPYLSQRFCSAKQALVSLRAKESSNEHSLRLKPDGTKVVLQRERNRIQITTDADKSLPSKLLIGSSTALIIGMLFLLAPQLFVLLLILAGALNLLVRRLLIRLFAILSSAKPLVAFEIDRQRGIRMGKRKNYASAVNWGDYTTPFESIDLLAYTLGYQFKPYTVGNKTVRQRIGGVPPELSIHAGDRTYTVGHNQLSTAEFWWLAQELSDFLDLELQTIYPTPIVTITEASTSTCGC